MFFDYNTLSRSCTLYDAVVHMYSISCVHSPLSQEETYHILQLFTYLVARLCGGGKAIAIHSKAT